MEDFVPIFDKDKDVRIGVAVLYNINGRCCAGYVWRSELTALSMAERSDDAFAVVRIIPKHIIDAIRKKGTING
jgi:hypothetical protein